MAAGAKAKTGDQDRVIIKKYANRRLYNTAKSSYVTLDDLAKMVREGQDFSVYDAKSGEDITRSVLTQIIFEEEAKGQNMLPTNFLRQLIRLYGDTLQGLVPSYLDASMDTFAKNQERMRAAFGANPAMQNLEALTRSNMEWFEQAMRMLSPFSAQGGRGEAAGETQSDEPPAKAGEGPGLGQEIDALQQQLREMQTQLEKLTRGKG